MSTRPSRFPPALRCLHWLMAVLVIAMLVIGLAMTSSLSERPLLLAIHRPLGLLVGILALLRLIVRLGSTVPSLPAGLPPWQANLARASDVALYALMIALPLIGWCMLSAGGLPMQLWPGTVLPPLLSPAPDTYALLRQAHQWAAWTLSALVLLHIGAALQHAWIARDGVWQSMAGGRLPTDRT